jgi:copper transport protein
LDDGVYTVSWRVVSKVDGHLTSGAFAFGVGVSPDEIEVAEVPESAVAGPAPLEVLARFAIYTGLALAIGAAGVCALAFDKEPSWARMFAASALAFAVAGTLLLGLDQLRSADVAVGTYLGTSLGHLFLWRLAGLVAATLAVILVARRPMWTLVGLGALGATVAHVWGGHAGAGPLAGAKIASQVVHVGAVGLWIGGLTVLLLGLRGLEPAQRERPVRRFSTMAGVALAVVAATGLVRALNEIATWSDLFATTYGRLVVAKVVLLGVLALLGLRNRTRSLGLIDKDVRPLRRVSAAELGVAALILVLTAVLAATPPARGTDTGPEAVVAVGNDLASSVELRLEISPGVPGPNTFEASVEVLRGAEVRGISLRLSPLDAQIETATLAMEPDGNNWAVRGPQLSAFGRWGVVAVVDRGAQTVEVPLTFHTACPPGRVQEVGDLRLQDIELGVELSLQGYVDPARPGGNEAHFTFFDETGVELAMADDPVVRAISDSEDVALEVRRASEGHFLAGGDLESGRWTFSFMGETEGGDRIQTCFTDEIGR